MRGLFIFIIFSVQFAIIGLEVDTLAYLFFVCSAFYIAMRWDNTPLPFAAGAAFGFILFIASRPYGSKPNIRTFNIRFLSCFLKIITRDINPEIRPYAAGLKSSAITITGKNGTDYVHLLDVSPDDGTAASAKKSQKTRERDEHGK